VIKNVASNKLPIMDGGVYVCTIMTGIWGLIATAMFGDLFGRSEGHFPLGHQFAIFTTAWILFLVVGVTGIAGKKSNGSTNSDGSGDGALRAWLFVAALVGYAYAMGNDWYVHDQQDLIAPMGGFQWTIKAGTFFIEPAKNSPYVTQGALEHFIDKQGRHKFVNWCDTTDPIWHNESAPADATHLKNPNANLQHLVGNQNLQLQDSDGVRRHSSHHNHRAVTDRPDHYTTNRNHYPDQCYLPARPTMVRGEHVVGLWSQCYCKDTTALTCRLFGSYWPMLNGRTQSCNVFNVARAMILIVGILAFIALGLASMLIGNLRRPSLHALSNKLCWIVTVLGLISSVLFGAVLYDVKKLSADFALYLCGWWLIFFAALLGHATASHYADQDTKIIPMTQLSSPATVQDAQI